MPEINPGDVLSYRPRDGYHCRQATALVSESGMAFDTFWGLSPCGERHVLTADELATAEVQFNVNDFDMLDEYAAASKATWETFHPDDRGRIGSQHQWQSVYYVRKGATPDLGTQIENARAKVEEAESNLRSAEHRLEWAREDLAKLEAAALPSQRGDAT